MKILQILPALNQGGVEYYVLENCHHIAQYADSYVISSGGRLVEPLTLEGNQHLTLPIEKKNLRSLFQIGKLRKMIEEIHPDIIHIHSRLQAWLVHFVLKRLSYRPKIVTTVHGFNSINRYSRQMLKADRVIVVSEALKQYLIQSYPQAPVDKFEVIAQGIDPHKFNPTSAINPAITEQVQALGIDLKKDKIILLAGRITRIKGIPLLIHLMDQLKKNGYHSIKALIVGSYDKRNEDFYQEMQKLIKDKRLDNNIFWFGTCDDMPSMYRLVDVTLSITSKPESYGRAVLESLASGTPVIGFDYGGVGENLAKFYPNGRVKPHDFCTLYEFVLQELAIDKQNKKLPQVSDTIEQSQAKLKLLYESLT